MDDDIWCSSCRVHVDSNPNSVASNTIINNNLQFLHLRGSAPGPTIDAPDSYSTTSSSATPPQQVPQILVERTTRHARQRCSRCKSAGKLVWTSLACALITFWRHLKFFSKERNVRCKCLLWEWASFVIHMRFMFLATLGVWSIEDMYKIEQTPTNYIGYGVLVSPGSLVSLTLYWNLCILYTSCQHGFFN